MKQPTNWVGIFAGIVSLTALCTCSWAQGRGAAAPPANAQAAAGIDLTGYWVSVVTEDWRFRMVTPPKGDFASVPLNAEGRKLADSWDPAKDESAGEQCRAFGAPSIMRIPGRVHITWQDPNTLKVEMDSGTQTRLFHFGQAPAVGKRTWQGVSVAQWEGQRPVLAGAATQSNGPGSVQENRFRGGDLKVVTSNLRAGYLRTNGVPYSEGAALTEFYDVAKESNGDTWMIVTTIVNDPKYLQQEFITSTHFKKQADGSNWSPSPCTAR